MFLYKIAQGKLLNIILLLSSIIVWHIVTNNLTSAGYEIVKNISYSVIASIIFYYINSVYVSIKKDKHTRNFLIEHYQSVRSDIMLYITLCMPDRDREIHIRLDDLKNPIFFRNYFRYQRKGHNGMSPWSSFPYHQDTEVENIKKMFFAICQFNELYLQNQHNIFLSSEARAYFNSMGKNINEYKNYPDVVFLLIDEITDAYSWHSQRYYPEDPHLHFLRKENYMKEKWRYIKCYATSAYIIFWVLFAMHTLT